MRSQGSIVSARQNKDAIRDFFHDFFHTDKASRTTGPTRPTGTTAAARSSRT